MSSETTISTDDAPSTSYQQISAEEPGDDARRTASGQNAARKTLYNFVIMSVLFSANHGCVVACLALATARLGSTGAWQSGILYLFYTSSSVLGSTYIVKKFGSRNSMWLGMGLYCAYVLCFWVATKETHLERKRLAAYLGAAIGGLGAGFLWTAQGAYFANAAEEHAGHLGQPISTSTALLAGIFAFFYLSEEVILRLLSTVLVGSLSWASVFALYFLVALVSTIAMPLVRNYSSNDDYLGNTQQSIFYKVTAAAQLLWSDPKMKYMIGLNAVFGFAAAFLNSYVNGEVVPIALNDTESRYIGVLTSWVSFVAAGMSLFFGRISPRSGKGPILTVGTLCFFGVVFPFIIDPNASHYGWLSLMFVYTCHGVGRATFEGTLKATFADFFPYEKEGAFANIILQNGLSGALGYVLTFSLSCKKVGRYCIEYRNGTLHDVLTFELLVVGTSIFAILGYLRAAILHRREQRRDNASDAIEEEEEAETIPMTSNTAAMVAN